MALTDFNDLYQLQGLEAVKRQIWAAIPTSRLSWIDLSDDASNIIDREIPELVQIVEGMLVENCKVVIASGSKSYKTWLTIALALHIAQGQPFWNRPTRKSRVLYVDLELRKRGFDYRCKSIAKECGLELERGQLIHLPLRGMIAGLSVHEIITRIVEAAKHFQCGVVVVDPVYKLNTEGDENSSRDQTILFNEIDRITTEAKCAVILNDHFSKGNQAEKDPLDAIRGSSAKGGDVDGAIVLRRHDEQNCFRVDVIQRELPPIDPFVIGWEFPVMKLREDLDPEEMKKPKSGKSDKKPSPYIKLLSSLKEHDSGDPITVQQWARLSRISVKDIQDYLPKMRQWGWVATDGLGEDSRKYITDRGLEELESQ